MSAVGALLALACATLLVLAIRPPSRVARDLGFVRRSAAVPIQSSVSTSILVPAALAASGLGWSQDQFVLAKVGCALALGLIGGITTLLLPLGPLVVVAFGYAGFVLPSLVIEHRANIRRRSAEVASASLIEWTHALVGSGRPVETALVALARRGTGAELIDLVLARVVQDYVLGAPLHASLARASRDASLTTLTRLAERLDRSRELGEGSLAMLEDMRDEVRAASRDRALEAASRVEGTLTMILTLCYLPALALLVVIPLFLTLLAGLFS